jgi:integrase
MGWTIGGRPRPFTMLPKPLPYIKKVRARGKVYEYFDTGKKVDGKRVYNRLPPRSDKSFGQVYAGMVAGRHARENIASAPTIAALSRAYQKDKKFTQRANSTQLTYLIYLRVIEEHLGMAAVNLVERRDIQALMDRMADRPSAANMVLLIIRNLYRHAIQRQWVEEDPSKHVEMMEQAEEEHEPWPEPLLEAALQDEAVQLPVALLYYTAQRIGDVCKMRWSDIRDGYLYVKQEKTGKELDIRLHRDLAAILDRTPRSALTILHDKLGRPRKSQTLRLHLKAFAETHGEKIVPHGLRKNAVIALLEVGCSMAETSSISGQSLQVVERYARRRNTRRLGSAAVLKWEGTEGQHGKHRKTGA